MKLILIAALALLSWFYPLAATIQSKPNSISKSIPNSETVWICNGKYATKYHKTDDCSGLNNCKSTITSIDKNDAEKMGRSACSVCY